jgi:hypothetical protein
MCGMNCPAHTSGTIVRQELQPANSITNSQNESL